MPATVVATFSRRMQLRTDDGRLIDARIKGKKLRPVCGDRVEAAPLKNESDWLISAILPRDNLLARPNLRGGTDELAANVDQLVVVAAALPKADWFIVDRYLAAAELMPTSAAVVYNKTDLEAAGDELAVYAGIGYPVISTSVESGEGIDALKDILAGKDKK